MRVSNLIVDRNLEAFSRIVTAKYSRGQVDAYSAYDDQTFPRVDITLEDMERSGDQPSEPYGVTVAEFSLI
jgi:hypothetical protein